MFKSAAAKLEEKYESTICCDVDTDDPSKSVQFFKPVSDDISCLENACQLGLANLLNCFLVCFGDKKTLSMYVGFCSSTTQHLKSVSILSGNGSKSLTYK